MRLRIRWVKNHGVGDMSYGTLKVYRVDRNRSANVMNCVEADAVELATYMGLVENDDAKKTHGAIRHWEGPIL